MEISSFPVQELGNTTYLVSVPEAGEIVAIDPPRDVDHLMDKIDKSGLRLTWTLETHVHNDFVSGCRELVAEVGAKLGASAEADLRYPWEQLRDGQELVVGPYRLRVLATPGHTPEHVSYLLLNEKQNPLKLFSGGSLMVGTAARPDLLGPADSWRLATGLRRSLQDRMLALPDDVQVLPTHGGGSFCATGSGGEKSTTIGNERKGNPLALAKDDTEFAAIALGQKPYPSYFDRMRSLNQMGAPLIGRHLPEPNRLTVEEFETGLARGAAILDLRPAAAVSRGHLPGSYAVGVDGSHSSWVGWLISPERPLLFVSDDRAQERESVRQLARIGYDRIVGVLDGGVDAWVAGKRPLKYFGGSDAKELEHRLQSGERLIVVDVREGYEWFSGHIPGSVNRPLHELAHGGNGLPRGPELAVHCGHLYRGVLGASLLEQLGYDRLTVVEDGFDGWMKLHGRAGASR
jgi:hydroxyacylglutathione hydrolase